MARYPRCHRLRLPTVPGTPGLLPDLRSPSVRRDRVHRVHFATRAQARSAIFEFIEVFHNRQRRHSTIGMVSPAEFERDYARALSS